LKKCKNCFKRENNSLTISIKDHDSIVFIDKFPVKEPCDPTKLYVANDYWPEINTLIIEEIHALGADCEYSYQFLNLNNKSSIQLLNKPEPNRLSSNKKLLVEFNFYDGPCGYSPLRLFEITDGVFQSKLNLGTEVIERIMKKEPEDVSITHKWIDNETIAFYITKPNSKVPLTRPIFQIIKQNGEWQLKS
ncbi:MAG: hypothetical protein SFU25_12155, partial [Candidatus Caenarcaniphilales bacterium]|nr:hypothetical protein [Candidatus Caenarcaniphilales bacterium]